MLHQAGRLKEAESVYKAILEKDPANADALHYLGMIAHQVDRNDIAADLIGRALALDGSQALYHYNLGEVLRPLGRPGEAVKSYQRALAINPSMAEAHNSIGVTLLDQFGGGDAAESFRRAVEIDPANPMAITNLGVALQKDGKPEEGIAAYKRALEIDPGFAAAHNNLGSAYGETGRIKDSLACYRRALEIDPDLLDAHSNIIFNQDFYPGIDQAAQQAERKRFDDRFIQPLADKIESHANSRDPDRRLRIGYVSGDFKRHSACQGFAPLILEHDRDRFDVICYAGNVVSDAVTDSLRSAATLWRPVSKMPDDQLARTIREDGIDILVDLSGHTKGNRLLAFGQKPAPLQATGIGHMPPGVSTIDYRLTTPLITLPEEEALFPETPIYLSTYFGFLPPADAPPMGGSPCQERGTVTFGCLNRFSKVTDEVLSLWAGILNDVPESRLLIKCSHLDEPSPRQRVVDFFADAGIAADRLIVLGGTAQRQHLEAYNSIDIALDTFPQGGGITTLESLWMGAPVVGRTDSLKIAHRLIEVICRPLGLDAWIAESADDYRRIAAHWAARPEDLADLRPQLRDRVSELYSRFPGDVEKAYRAIWKRWCNGEAPTPLYVDK